MELVNDGLYFNFGKFDASCKNGKWTLYLPVNAPSGNKLRKENARYEYVGTITFDKNNPFKVKTFYITDKKETNPWVNKNMLCKLIKREEKYILYD